MKSYRKELFFTTSKRREFINITPQVESCLTESGVKEGLLLCNAMHITAEESWTSAPGNRFFTVSLTG